MGLFDTIVAKTLPIVPRRIVRVVANRYIAGTTVDDAMATVAKLNAEGALGTIDALGEFVKSRAVAEAERERSLTVLDRIHTLKHDSGLSVKLTSLGLDIDYEFCRRNLDAIVSRAHALDLFVRIDMENTPYTDRTLTLAEEMWGKYRGSVGVVLQAYLRRTRADIARLAPSGMTFRLCKGIYRESEEDAYQGREEVQRNYLDCLRDLLDCGTYVGIATHDDVLIDGAKRMIAEKGLGHSAYEFQMLLGVRDPKRRELIAEGHRMRVYVPFGEDWYGYSVRRLQENPAIAGHIFKAMFSRR